MPFPRRPDCAVNAGVRGLLRSDQPLVRQNQTRDVYLYSTYGSTQSISGICRIQVVDLVSSANVQIGAKTWDSAYQLLPAPNAPGNPVILNDGTPQDFYQPSVAQILGLKSAKLTSVAKKTFATLDFTKRPSSIQYSFIVGTNQETVEAIDINSSQSPPSFAPITDDLGDGTVPIWSAGYTGGTAVPTNCPAITSAS